MTENKCTTSRAVVATVKFGLIEIEGLMLPDGSYVIAIPQIADLLITGDVKKDGMRTSKSQLSKNLKRLCGESFRATKTRTELGNQAITVVTLEQFEVVLAKLDRVGNKQAQELRDELAGLSLRQLFADSFEEKFEQEERQDWLIKRQATKFTFRDMTDELKSWGFTDGKDYAKFIAILQAKLGIPKGTRDIQDLKTLNDLEIAQTKLATYIECGRTPWEALKLLKGK